MFLRPKLGPGWLATLCLGLLITSGHDAYARVKLLMLPVRSKVEVHLEHPDATLVEEERVVPLVRGDNQIDFSWANTRIDSGTIVFRVLGTESGPQTGARVLSVSYPPGEQALVWSVSAKRAGAARVRISYLLGGLSRSFSYRAIASKDESTLTLRRYLELQNTANEGFGQATLVMRDDRRVDTPINIAETRKVLVDRHINVPVQKTYTADLGRYGYLDRAEKKLRVPMHYVLHNDEAHHLGRAALPPGKVRIFQTDSKGTQAFLGEDWGRFTPVGDRMALSLGTAQDVVVRRHLEKRNNLPVKGALHHVEVVIRYEIENFKGRPVTLDIIESIPQLRQELGLSAARQPELEVGTRTSFAGGIDKARSGIGQFVVHQELKARQASGAKKYIKRLHLIFRNEM